MHPQQLNFDTNLEMLPILIDLKTTKTVLLVCYKPPKLPLPIFEDNLSNLLNLLPYRNVILLGDFNADLLQKSTLPCTSSKLGYIQRITKPTHIFGGLLDHIYCKNIEPSEAGTMYCYYSDHTVIYAAF